MFNHSWWDFVLPEYCGYTPTINFLGMCLDSHDNKQSNCVRYASQDLGGFRRDQYCFYDPPQRLDAVRRMPIEWEAPRP